MIHCKQKDCIQNENENNITLLDCQWDGASFNYFVYSSVRFFSPAALNL